MVVAARGRPLFVMAFTVRAEKIVAIDVLSDPDRLRQLDLTALDGLGGLGQPVGGHVVQG